MQTSVDRVVEVSIAAGPAVGIELKLNAEEWDTKARSTVCPWRWVDFAIHIDIDEAMTLQDDLRETLEALQRQELAAQ